MSDRPGSFADAVGSAVSSAGSALSSAGSALSSAGSAVVDGVVGAADGFNDARDAVLDRVGLMDASGPVLPAEAAAVAAEMTRVAADAGRGLPTSVQPEAFAAMSHEEIYLGSQQLAPQQVEASARMWTSAHAALVPLVDRLWSEIGAVLGVDWQGATADRALDDVTRYRDESLAMVTLLEVVSTKLTASHAGLEATRVAVPPPETFGFADGMELMSNTLAWGPLGGFGALTAQRAALEERRAEAVLAMDSIYVPTIVGADSGVPALPLPFDPTGTTAAEFGDAGSGGAGFGGSGSAGSTFGGSTAGNATADDARAPALSGSAGSPLEEPAPTTAAAAPNSTPSGAAPMSAAGPTASGGGVGSGGPGSSGWASGPLGGPGTSGVLTSPTRWSPTTPGRSGAGSTSSGGRPGSGSAGGGPRTTAGGARGAFGSGGGGGGVSGAGGGILQSGSAAGGGARAAGYGPGAMMPGARAGGDQDGQHTTAGYLISADNGDELVGELPLVAPPVIG